MRRFINALYYYTPLKVYTPDNTIKTDLQTNEGAEENENKNVCVVIFPGAHNFNQGFSCLLIAFVELSELWNKRKWNKESNYEVICLNIQQ